MGGLACAPYTHGFLWQVLDNFYKAMNLKLLSALGSPRVPIKNSRFGIISTRVNDSISLSLGPLKLI